MAGAVGGFAGGLLMSRLRLRPPGAVHLMMLSTAVFCLGLVVVVLLECPQVPLAGHVDADTHRSALRAQITRVDC